MQYGISGDKAWAKPTVAVSCLYDQYLTWVSQDTEVLALYNHSNILEEMLYGDEVDYRQPERGRLRLT